MPNLDPENRALATEQYVARELAALDECDRAAEWSDLRLSQLFDCLRMGYGEDGAE